MAQIKHITDPFIEQGMSVGQMLLQTLEGHSGPRLLADIFNPHPVFKEGEITLTLTMEVNVSIGEARDFLRTQGYDYRTPERRKA